MQLRLRKSIKKQKKKFEIESKKLIARVDEKDFEYNSKIKQMMKEFQTQLGGKEQEIQHSVQEAIEVAQRDERKIICEYDEQIMEMQRELRLREDDMLELRQETETQMDKLIAEKEQVEKEYQDQMTSSEQLYNERLEDLVKRHETELLARSHANEMEAAENKMNNHMNDVEQSYVIKMNEQEEQHRMELSSQEKKYKAQLKRTKNEMRKLLLEKGVTIPNGDDLSEASSPRNSNPSSDVEMEPGEVAQLKEKVSSMSKELKSLREREKILAMQVERASPNTPNKNRPATLILDQSLNDSTSSSPKSPQPIEFEYLRNILYQYMVGNQKKQMAKVLTAIVHFSPSQVKQILAKVEEQEAQVTEKKSASWL